MKRHEYKYFALELIKIFLCDVSLQRPVFKHRRDLVGNREIADLPTSSHCIYEPVSKLLGCEIRYLHQKLSVRQHLSHFILKPTLCHFKIPVNHPHSSLMNCLHVYSLKDPVSKKVLTFFN